MSTHKVSDEQIIKALQLSCGFQTKAAAMLGVSLQTVNNRIADNPHIREKVREILEARMDLVESELYKAIDAGERWALALMVKYKGKDRGYAQKIDQTVDGNFEFNVIVNGADPDREPDSDAKD